MPELPEVETIVRGINNQLVGKLITSMQISNPKSIIGDLLNIHGRKIVRADRRGKMIIIELSGMLYLVIHLKMTGQLIFRNSEFRGRKSELPEIPSKHTRVIFNFSDGSKLYFNDMRKFGWIKIVKSLESIFDNLGIDALSKELTVDYLFNCFKKKKISVKQILLDQSVIAGIGNIYADESLFDAGINPLTIAHMLSKYQVTRLVDSIPKILNLSIELGGSTRSDYRLLDGSMGKYLDEALVYGREEQPCRVCCSKIVRIKIGQRSSHYCPRCQDISFKNP